MDNQEQKSNIAATVKLCLLQFKNGIIDENPTLVQVLGMCPTLATTTSALNALGMGLATTAVLMCSNVFISLLRKLIPREIRIASYVIIISGFVTAVEMLIKAFLPSLDKSLGVFIPLIVVNCIILARAEAFASKNPVLPSFVDGLSMGLGFTFALFLLGSIREVIGAGTWFGINLFGESYKPVLLFIMPSGAFITLGFLIALSQKLRSLKKPHKADVEADLEPAQVEEPKTTETEDNKVNKDAD